MSKFKGYENNESAEELENDIRQRVEDLKDQFKTAVYSVVDWVAWHPQEAATLAGGLIFVWKQVNKYATIRRDARLRDSMIYDRSLGMYWETKRPLTANQRLTIEARHKAGEPFGQILSDMKLLKR